MPDTGNRIFNDRAIAYGLASVAALVFGSLMSWQLMALIDVRDRVIRMESSGHERRIGNLESAVFPPGPYRKAP